MVLTQSDIETIIYPNIMATITRANSAIVPNAIDLAVGEVKSYLSRYDLSIMFADDETFNDPFLRALCRDVAAWQIIKLANPNISYESIRTYYEDAISKLQHIQSGKITPQGWPYYAATATDLPKPGGAISANSNPKKNNHF